MAGAAGIAGDNRSRHELPLPWEVTAVVALDTWDRPAGPPQVLALLPGDQTDAATSAPPSTSAPPRSPSGWWTWRAARWWRRPRDYNGQIARGEDVISRIIYARKPEHLAEMQGLVVGTINRLLEAACKQVGAQPDEIFKLTVAGNTTMIHLLLAIPPEPHPPGAVHRRWSTTRRR